jgi:hypothetical protein
VIRRRSPIRRRKRPRPIRKGHEGRKVCDALWSELIRKKAEGRCEFIVNWHAVFEHGDERIRCGRTDYLQSHHPVSRARQITRHDPDNGLAVCRGCHFWIHTHLLASETDDFYRVHGIDLPKLEQRAAVRGYRPDYSLIEIGLRLMIAGLVS